MQQDELIGKTLGSYRILATLGQGGMAKVYKAYQENLDREVAIKVLPPWFAADRSFVERFNLEARLVARLAHPNIVIVHDASEQQGHLYIVMQLISGGTLKHRFDTLHLEGKAMSLAEAVPIFSQIASALNYAHEQGIIHRDVKPVNVLMDLSGRPILSDFGIAKVLASSQEGLTRPGAGVGTPEYMSPEQCQGAAVDGRADIYAMGIMLFEAMTGATPFRGDSYPALAHGHIYEPPPRPSTINPSISPLVERIILTAIMKKPEQRFQRAIDLADALHQALNATPAQGVHYQSPGRIGGYGGAPQVTPPVEAMLLCPYCHKPNRAQMRFCTRCGQPMNRCGVCGTNNPANNRFCTKCGQSLVL